MLYGLFVLLACQLLGEAIRHVTSGPVPGPVIGILLLIVYLALSERFSTERIQARARSVEEAGDGLLLYLGVLFVPAGVGVAGKLDLILQNGLGIVLTLVGSTAITMLVTVAAFRLVRLASERRS